MSPSTGHRGIAAVASAVLLGGLVVAGCTAGHTVKAGYTVKAGHPATKISHQVAGNHLVAGTPVAAGKGTVGAFIAKLQASAATPFEVKYLASGGRAGGMIVYAVRPPDGLLFSESPPVGHRRQIVVNGSGEFLCIQRGTGHARWTCQQLSEASAAAQNKNFAVYTAAHWATYLKKVALTASATTFTMPADAPPTIGKNARAGGMSCLGFRAAGAGISTICAAARGILGSVILCKGPVSFAMEWYTTSPPASLFQLPAGAMVTRLKASQA